MYQANAHVGQEGLDGQISTSVCTGIKSDRDLVAFHEILLATVFGLYLFPMFICGGRRDSHTYWHGLYDQFSSSVELGFYHLSSFRCSDLGCWVYYENTLPSPPRSEH